MLIKEEGRASVMSRLGLPSRIRSLLALSLVVAAFAALPASRPFVQPTPHGPSYLFLSPNTEDHLSLAEASRRLRAPAQLHYHRLARDILQRLGVPNAKVHDTLGDWGDCVENSLLVVLPSADPQTLRCAAAWFGFIAQQKAVLAFHPDPAGTHLLTILDLPGYDLAMARWLLDRHGIRDRTILVQAGGCRVVVLEIATPSPSLPQAAREGGGTLRHCTGRGECLAGSTRTQAQQHYAEILRAYQVARPLRPLARLP
jgi:hypothetical protein